MSDIRAPDPKELAKEDYLSGMKYKDLAEKYKVSLNTIKSWVKRYSWAEEKKQKGAPKKKGGAPFNNKNAVGNNGGAPKGNRNSVGHGAPKRNKNAETHGFFSKYLPEEAFEIMQQVEQRSSLDMLWDMILIKYTAIIRAQKIMYVKDQDDITKNLKKKKDGDAVTEREWEFQYAWDKQANFLQAQARAMAELRSLIKQYDETLNANQDMVTEEQRLRVEKLKIDIENAKGDSKNNESKSWADAIQEIAAKRRGKDG